MRSWRYELRRISAQAVVRRSLGAVTLFAVILSVMLGGQRYFYCRPMDAIMTHTACGCARAPGEPTAAPTIRANNDCFEVRFIGRLATFVVHGDFAVPAAAWVGTLPSPSHEVAPINAASVGADPPIRAGPFSPTASRSRLMVFLT